jgi:hypothetical protein
MEWLFCYSLFLPYLATLPRTKVEVMDKIFIDHNTAVALGMQAPWVTYNLLQPIPHIPPLGPESRMLYGFDQPAVYWIDGRPVQPRAEVRPVQPQVEIVEVIDDFEADDGPDIIVSGSDILEAKREREFYDDA